MSVGAPPYTIERLTAPLSDDEVRSLARLLVDAVESGAAVSFVAPLAVEDAETWWRNTLAAAGPRSVVLVARAGPDIVGSVQLHAAWAPNQPGRAEIVKLIVHRRCRGAGLGARLMQAAEDAARAAGFTLLTLDAKAGGAAERIYRRLGWVPLGTIPGYALDPDGTPHAAIFFYKPLREVEQPAVRTRRLAFADDLRATVTAAHARLRALAPDAVRAAPPGKWSPADIIGHLIDSASNNHQRFVRARFRSDLRFEGYDQDAWVSAQAYASAPWHELLDLWLNFNLHLARVMETTPEPVLRQARADHNLDLLAWEVVAADEPATLEYFMRDYVGHLKHHLRQIDPSLAAAPERQRQDA